MTIAISVLLPTRGRSELFATSVRSLLDHAKHPDQIEIVVRRDRDDMPEYPVLHRAKVLVGSPLGYAGMHTYFNECASLSCGRWLVIWNDDCEMLTDGWDEPLYALSPEAWWTLPHEHFPVISRRWYETTGRFSASPHVDTFVWDVAKLLMQQGHLPTEKPSSFYWNILHKCDELDDEGSERRRREILGPGGTSAAFFTPQMRAEIERDAARIAAAILGAA